MPPIYVRSNLKLLFRQYNIDRLRDEKPELTQEDFAELTGLSRATVNRWMSSKPLEYRKLGYERSTAVEAFTRALGITREQLLTPVDKDGNAVEASLETPELMPGAA